jgi:hypothetical protein
MGGRTSMSRFDVKVQRRCALSGLLGMLIAGVSQIAVLPWGQQGWVFNQPSMGAAPAQIARFYAQNKTGVNVGTVGFELAWVILIFWTVQYSLMLWRLDDGVGHRVLSAGVGFCAMTIPFLMMVVTAFWTVAAYHAGSGDPQITRAMSDLGYIGSFIWFWTAVVTMAGGGWLMLKFHRGPDAFPTWIGRLGIVGGCTQAPAICVHFFHTGIWSLNGLLGWYVPLGGWFIWMLAVCPMMLKILPSITSHPSSTTRPPRAAVPA